ncbi:MAG: hypothetical protein O7C75_04130, partial [Verrucomicrobia bacterium]|nr:hypothetical protein [Verrucomicrobiota bacterium]
KAFLRDRSQAKRPASLSDSSGMLTGSGVDYLIIQYYLASSDSLKKTPRIRRAILAELFAIQIAL